MVSAKVFEAERARVAAVEAEKFPPFLEALSQLTREHGVKLGSCGCCGSPWLDLVQDADKATKYLHNFDFSKLEWETPDETAS